ncbi:MAG: hypothetical protein ACREDE_11700, partial [Thermoplasmata archaeon]
MRIHSSLAGPPRGPTDEARGGGVTITEREPLVALAPFESVIVTLTLKDPVAVGVHASELALRLAQPVGRPAQEYPNPPEPPATATDRVVVVPELIRDWEAVGGPTESAGDIVNRLTPLDAVSPSASVTATESD